MAINQFFFCLPQYINHIGMIACFCISWTWLTIEHKTDDVVLKCIYHFAYSLSLIVMFAYNTPIHDILNNACIGLNDGNSSINGM